MPATLPLLHAAVMLLRYAPTAQLASLELQDLEKTMYGDLKKVTEYFGEEFAPADAIRLLRTVRDFVVLFERGLADIKVGGWVDAVCCA